MNSDASEAGAATASTPSAASHQDDAAPSASSDAPSAPASDVPQHSKAFLLRRGLNWFPLGLLYAFLYMGRYNLNVAKNSLGVLMTEEDFGSIFFVGTLVYGFAFLLNGPLTDAIGGKKASLIGAFGAAAANLAMGLYLKVILAAGSADNSTIRIVFSVLFALNMYFQSFGAVAIVKVNSRWFHVRERGGFSGIFGVMISSGIFVAYTINGWVLEFAGRLSGISPGESTVRQTPWVFLFPAALLLVLAVIELFLLKDRPSQAGFEDFNTGDATSGEADDTPTSHILKKILTNPILITLAFIELCTGVVRQSVMQWYPFFAKNVLSLPSHHAMRNGDWSDASSVLPFFAIAAVCALIAVKFLEGRRKGWLIASAGLIALVPFLQAGWGGLLFVAGVIGGNVAGFVSDLFFQSRRAPAAGGFYALIIVCVILMAFTMGHTSPVIDSIHPGAEQELSVLKPGDRILSVADKGDFKEWRDVARAFAAVPARCEGEAKWDVKRSICSTKPQETSDSLAVSTGLIPFEIERAGQRMTVQVKDPSPVMRAGDERRLRIQPVSTHSPFLMGVVVFLISLAVIGTHGLLSGTATMDFGGTKGAATAVGLIDGFVYLGTAIQSISLGYLTSASWDYWPWFMLPFAILGLCLCLKIWKARPMPKKAA